MTSLEKMVKKGTFTLVEMLVVIGIVGVLAAISVPVISHLREKARRTTCTTRLSEIGKGLLLFGEKNKWTFPETVYYPPHDFYPAKSRIRSPVQDIGLGHLVSKKYITPEILICPSNDWTSEAEIKEKWAKVPKVNTDSTYLYRAESGASSLIFSKIKSSHVVVLDNNSSYNKKRNHRNFVNCLLYGGSVTGVSDPNDELVLRNDILGADENTEAYRVFVNADEKVKNP